MLKLYLWLRNLLKGEEGQTLTEYALILVLIAVAVIAVVLLLGTTIGDVFQQIVDGLTG